MEILPHTTAKIVDAQGTIVPIASPGEPVRSKVEDGSGTYHMQYPGLPDQIHAGALSEEPARALISERCTGLQGVPTMFAAVLEWYRQRGTRPPPLRSHT
jgi:hypothetical protein